MPLPVRRGKSASGGPVRGPGRDRHSAGPPRLRTPVFLPLILCLLLSLPVKGRAAGDPPPTAELLFRCADRATARALLADPRVAGLPAAARLEAALPGSAGAPRELEAILRLRCPPHELPLARKALAALRPVWIEEPPRRHSDRLPNDPRYGELWALPLIQAPQAWDIQVGEGEIILAVVDTGCDLTHPDLSGALWINQAEAQGLPGVDDDGNGVVDDLHGADLLDGDGDPSPAPGDASHGTHTAGTAACVTDNATGLACAAWRAALMPVRAGHLSSISRGVEGVWYAAANGACVISCSWGGDSFSAYEYDVIQAVRALGCLVVASAGNNGTERLHYPGAYEGVLCVAATTPQDTRMPGSQIGWWVDVSAPGQDILSSMIGGGYALRSGTSMATPLVASLAALAWSRHPTENGDQIRERVKAGCDNIDALNPGLAGKLGRGRINAWRTLEQTVRAVQVNGSSLTDSDGDGIPEPGETIQLRLQVEALLGSFTGLQAQCQAQPGEATVVDGAIDFGSLAQGQSVQPADHFTLTLAGDLEPGREIRLRLLFTAAGGFSQEENLLILVAPTYADHDNGQLQISLGGHGVQGYYDFEAGQAVGGGLRWPPGSPSHLYHGSLLLASDGGQVAHAASYLTGMPAELAVLPGGEIRRVAFGGELSSEAEFGAAGLAGLRVRQLGLSLEGEDWILLRFQLHNTGGGTIAGLQPGLWLDLDVGGTWANDTGGWDPSSGTGWQSQVGGPMLGLRLVSEEAASFRLCHWGEWSFGGLEDAELFSWLRGGFQQTQSDAARDWQCLLGAPALDLAPGQEREVAFALVAGAQLAGLQAAGAAARQTWMSLEVGGGASPARPGGLDLKVWPNPFNPGAHFSVTLAWPGQLAWQVVGLDGRRVAAGRREALPAGLHQEWLDLSGLASGLYLLRADVGERREMTRLLLLR